MRVEILSDGTKVIYHTPIEGVPFYSDWLKILLARGAAQEVSTSEIDVKTGLPKKRIVPLDRNQEQLAVVMESGSVGIVCIGCGELIKNEIQHVKVSGKLVKIFDKIRIGGFVQMREEDHIGHHEIAMRWRVKPMFKMGIGCKSCREKYAQIERDAASINEGRDLVRTFLAKKELAPAARVGPETTKATPASRCKHGLDVRFCAVCNRRQPNTKKVPTSLKAVTPYIDVFGKEWL